MWTQRNYNLDSGPCWRGHPPWLQQGRWPTPRIRPTVSSHLCNKPLVSLMSPVTMMIFSNHPQAKGQKQSLQILLARLDFHSLLSNGLQNSDDGNYKLLCIEHSLCARHCSECSSQRPNSPNNSVRYVLEGKWGTAVVGTKYSLDNVIPEHILLTTAGQDGRWPPQSLLHWNREESRTGPEHLGGSHCTTLPSGKGTGGLAERAFPPAEFLLCAILGEAFQNSLPCSKYTTTLGVINNSLHFADE